MWLIFREPRYHGRSLAYWTSQAGQWDPEEAAATREALQALGSSAVPYLIKRLEQPEPALRKGMQACARRFPVIGRWFYPPWYEQQELAAIALGEIGPPASNAIPALKRAIKRDNEIKPRAVAALMKIQGQPVDSLIQALEKSIASQSVPSPQMEEAWRHDAFTIGEFGTNAQAAVPLLCQVLAGTQNPIIASSFAQALGRIQSRPDLSVPALITALETRRECIHNSLWSLGEFGAGAKAAVPAIRRFVNAPEPAFRSLALEDLCRILPFDEVRPEEIDALIPLLKEKMKSPDPRIRVHAENMMKRIQAAHATAR
jgi:hypothetical protein